MIDSSEDNEFCPGSTTAAIFNEFRMKGKLCDAVLIVNGEHLNVHKNILCCSSKYFRVLFSKRWNGDEKREFTITGVEPEVMHLLNEFSYTGVLPITENNVEDLLITANYYCMNDALTLCSNFLKNQMCFENCIGIFQLAQTFCCEDLKMTASKFVLKNFVHVACVSEEFVELPLNDLLQFIERDDLNVRNEAFVFEAIQKWIGHSVHMRRESFAKLLSKVRLSLMDSDYFMNTVKCHEYVRGSNECRELIISAIQSMYYLSSPTSRNEMAHPRLPYSVLFAFGGWSSGSPTNAIECYDSRANIWVNNTVNEESPRAYHGTAFYQGYIFIVGGFDSMAYFNSVRRFDPVGFIWKEVAPMHFHRCYVSIVVLNNYLYALGGFNGFTRLNTAERYDHQKNQWIVIPSMQEQRSDASATVLNGKIFICGGFNGNECLSTAECFTPETNQWTPIASMNSRRSGIGVIACGGFVYAVGGFDGLNRLRTAEVYNEEVNSWSMLPNMLNPRSNFGLEVVDDIIVVAGGFNGVMTVCKAEGYDCKSKTWYDLAEMAVNRSALSCCVVDDLPNVVMFAAPRDFLRSPVRREDGLQASLSML